MADCWTKLPHMRGGPIRISFQSHLSTHRGKLVATGLRVGTPVYAACFIRKRQIVLETALMKRPPMFRLILMHELFHFVWTRLGNGARQQFADLLAKECEHGARGELGESADVQKALLARGDCTMRSRRWREYVCESFCDTAAWLYSGVEQNRAFTLGGRWKKRRAVWFQVNLGDCCTC